MTMRVRAPRMPMSDNPDLVAELILQTSGALPRAELSRRQPAAPRLPTRRQVNI
ncbi:hypothetical protein AB0C04_15755 [Micromonospora sp. NPDC048909]|uniref:hypothetical protein n=1 Tax=Micromonospora sp. NPDC048909 TaxID=3155643 RepID=UPI0033F385A8